jgi:hypothetical protein
LLALFHYISGGVTIAFSLLFGAWLVMMAAMFSFMPPPMPAGAHGGVNPELHGPPAAFFLVFAAFFALGIAYGIVELLAGRFLGQRRRRLFALLGSIPRLIFIPYGTILSVLTLIVLERPSVKNLFQR